MYEPLHHKYRPQTFAQLVGQGAIADTLTHALQQNRIAPAYLFCGPRGTGKTSSARILAKSLNCLTVDSPTAEPCGTCDVCLSVNRGNALDIVEIDAASNTGVDNIRELIERAQFAPVQCRYKLYVLDEVHMLSTAAFNALLKTLEEPPDRVVFVLATTDPQRVLPTIISRCQRFDFRRIPLPAMIGHLSYIATTESINIAEPAIQLIAQISQGGLRDAESLLDQLSLQADEITVETVWDLVGAVPEKDLLNLVRAIAADDGPALLERVRHLMDKGREPLIVLQSLVGFYRDLLIAKSAPARADLVAITPPTWEDMTAFAKGLSAAQLLASQQKLQTSEVQVKNTTQPRLWLEITLTGLLPSALGAIADLATGATRNASSTAARSVLSVANTKAPQPPPQPVPQPVSQPVSQPVPQMAAQPPVLEVAAAEPAKTPPAKTPLTETPPAPTIPAVPVAVQSTLVEPPAPARQVAQAPAPTEQDSASIEAGSEAGSPPPLEETAPAEVAFGTLSDLWVKILAALEPRGTQMLMNQQGTLLAFDGVGAKVGFRSASLQKMAQQRVPNLEKAFEAVFQRAIRVSLEVVTAEEATEKTVASSGQGSAVSGSVTQPQQPSQRVASVPNTQPPPAQAASASSTNAQAAQNQRPNLPKSAPQNQAPIQSNGASNSQPTAKSASARPADTLPSAPSSSGAAPGQWQTNQEQDNIKRFAQFFNGQIVNLDDAEEGGQSDRKSSDPGPDVPF
ncbi:MAG: DNA polymerase III subunit gamma/tau [Cyanobacteria bacterium J06649_5]